MEYEVKVTARNRTASRLDMAKWILTHAPSDMKLRSSDAMYIVDVILKGETWRPEYCCIDRNAYETNPYFNVEFIGTEEEDPWAERIALQESYWELCRKGAAGDAEAAMAFCKLEMENKVSHSAYA